MKNHHKLLPLVAACALAAALAATIPALAGNTGLAFVHGTGKQTDAANEYWTMDMINSVKQGLPNQEMVLVVNCDFKQYMWTAGAAGCLADQLYPFIVMNNITDLVVETHSNGANVMRWIMSNPAADKRYPTIITALRWVNALAPSSLGTPLANAVTSGNVFELLLGESVGYKSDAVRMQQTDWMAYYNDNWMAGTAGRPNLAKNFYNVVGTNVYTIKNLGALKCGGYARNIALALTQSWLASCSDGFLECGSQQGAGATWFRDVDRTNSRTPLSHNQSRRNCSGLDAILRSDIATAH